MKVGVAAQIGGWAPDCKSGHKKHSRFESYRPYYGLVVQLKLEHLTTDQGVIGLNPIKSILNNL